MVVVCGPALTGMGQSFCQMRLLFLYAAIHRSIPMWVATLYWAQGPHIPPVFTVESYGVGAHRGGGCKAQAV